MKATQTLYNLVEKAQKAIRVIFHEEGRINCYLQFLRRSLLIRKLVVCYSRQRLNLYFPLGIALHDDDDDDDDFHPSHQCLFG